MNRFHENSCLALRFRATLDSFRANARFLQKRFRFGSRNNMPLLSALEDFLQRSLGGLPTLWEKLRFVSELREGAHYRHWGMEQKFGEKMAQAAIAEAHSGLCNEMASTKLAELWLTADQAAHREELQVADFLNGMMSSAGSRPADTQGVAPEHFEFILTNLYRVAHSRSTSNHLAA